MQSELGLEVGRYGALRCAVVRWYCKHVVLFFANPTASRTPRRLLPSCPSSVSPPCSVEAIVARAQQSKARALQDIEAKKQIALRVRACLRLCREHHPRLNSLDQGLWIRV